MKMNIQIYLAEFVLEWEIFHKQIFYKIGKGTFLFNIVFEHRAIYEIMWKNMVGADRPQTNIKGVTGGTDQTSGECSLGHTIPI